MVKTKCKYCGGDTHYSTWCFSKPKRPIKTMSDKTLHKKQITDRLWFELNPPSPKGTWECYLNISPDCFHTLTRSTITLEHVRSKKRYPQLRFDEDNLRPSCSPCNRLKGSLDLEDLVENHPHLSKYIKSP